MKKEEREKYKQQMKTYEKLGALKFQKIVFGVEKLKYKLIKKVCPNYIRLFDKYYDHKKKKAYDKATSEKEIKKISRDFTTIKMVRRKEFYEEKNINYHMDSKRPTEIYDYLKANKQIHKDGLTRNLLTIPLLIAGVCVSFPYAIPLLVVELINTTINFECINIQNYNICRYKISRDTLKKKEDKLIEKRIEKYDDVSEMIYKTMEHKEDLPTPDEILNSIKTSSINKDEKIKQLKELIAQQIIERESSVKEDNNGVKVYSK